MSYILDLKIFVLGRQFFQHRKASFSRSRCGLRILKHVIHSRRNALPFYIYYFRNFIVFHSFFNVLVDITSVFTEVKFLDCLHCFVNGILRTFRLFYRLNWAFILVFDFEQLTSKTTFLQANLCLRYQNFRTNKTFHNCFHFRQFFA